MIMIAIEDAPESNIIFSFSFLFFSLLFSSLSNIWTIWRGKE